MKNEIDQKKSKELIKYKFKDFIFIVGISLVIILVVTICFINADMNEKVDIDNKSEKNNNYINSNYPAENNYSKKSNAINAEDNNLKIKDDTTMNKPTNETDNQDGNSKIIDDINTNEPIKDIGNQNNNLKTTKNNNSSSDTSMKDNSTTSVSSNNNNNSDGTQNNEKPSNDSSNVSISKQNALRTAKSYLRISAFSYSGLIEQLEYEKYSRDDAGYVDTEKSKNYGITINVSKYKNLRYL